MLKISEIFPAIQGEGKSIGQPVVFIRFYGCNLRCPWCDSAYAIEGGEYKSMEISDITDELEKYPQINTYVLTGGEPLLQLNTIQGHDLIQAIQHKFPNCKFEIETNGLLLDFKKLTLFKNLQLNISPKFYSAGNYDWWKQYQNPEMKKRIQEALFRRDYQFKFVLEHDDFRAESIQYMEKFIEYHCIKPEKVYVMSEGQTFNEQIPRMKEDLEYCLIKGYNYTPRLHIIVYDDKRGV